MTSATLTKDARFSSRIDSRLKKEWDAIFSSLGIKPSQALSMFYSQVIIHKGMPFDIKIPNSETISALNSTEFISYPDAKTALNDMWTD